VSPNDVVGLCLDIFFKSLSRPGRIPTHENHVSVNSSKAPLATKVADFDTAQIHGRRTPETPAHSWPRPETHRLRPRILLPQDRRNDCFEGMLFWFRHSAHQLSPLATSRLSQQTHDCLALKKPRMTRDKEFPR